MTQVAYLERLDDRGSKTVDTIGTQPGPVGGDGWSVIAQLPTSRLQTNRHYAFWVTGKVGAIRFSGPGTPTAGILQIALGDGGGLVHPNYTLELGLAINLQAGEALPFAFLVMFDPAGLITDPLWGGVWNNVFPLQLVGRIYRRGDPATYSAAFEVSDLVWTWADLDAIPSTDQLLTRQNTPVGLPQQATAAPIAQSINTVPAPDGDLWVHFWALSYKPQVGSFPTWEVGHVDSGTFTNFAARVGGGGSLLGLGHLGTNVYGVEVHLGGFWCAPRSGVTMPALAGRDQPGLGPSPGTGFHRFDVLSLRLAALGNVYYSSDPEELAAATASLTDGNFYPLEVPAEGRTWEPWTFAFALPVATATALDLVLQTNTGETLWQPTALCTALLTQQGVPCMASAPHGLGSGNPGVQYRLRFWEPGNTGQARTVRDIYLLTVYPVKDPDNQPPDPLDVGDPLEIVPGTEGPGVGSLLDPPLAPNVGMPETGSMERHRIAGATGYSRGWPTWIGTRRAWPLTWGPVTEAQRDDLVEFLRAHRVFRITPQRDAPVAVVETSGVQWSQIDVVRWQVRVDVAELVYLDP